MRINHRTMPLGFELPDDTAGEQDAAGIDKPNPRSHFLSGDRFQVNSGQMGTGSGLPLRHLAPPSLGLKRLRVRAHASALGKTVRSKSPPGGFVAGYLSSHRGRGLAGELLLIFTFLSLLHQASLSAGFLELLSYQLYVSTPL